MRLPWTSDRSNTLTVYSLCSLGSHPSHAAVSFGAGWKHDWNAHTDSVTRLAKNAEEMISVSHSEILFRFETMLAKNAEETMSVSYSEILFRFETMLAKNAEETMSVSHSEILFRFKTMLAKNAEETMSVSYSEILFRFETMSCASCEHGPDCSGKHFFHRVLPSRFLIVMKNVHRCLAVVVFSFVLVHFVWIHSVYNNYSVNVEMCLLLTLLRLLLDVLCPEMWSRFWIVI